MIDNLRKRYAHLHPLIFHRSVERARNDVELFDILDSCPTDFPIIWDIDERRWKTTNDLFMEETIPWTD